MVALIILWSELRPTSGEGEGATNQTRQCLGFAPFDACMQPHYPHIPQAYSRNLPFGRAFSVGNKFAVAIGVMPHTRSDAAQCLARAQQYTSLAQRADWSPELRRALAR